MLTGIFAAFRDLDEGRHRAEFYRMWATGCNAGFTHPQSFQAMGVRDSRQTEAARQWLLNGTERGRDVATLVRAEGRRFEPFERSLLTLGDESGSLDDTLRLLGDFYMKKHQLMLWVKKKMAYAVFTAIAACFVAPFPLLFFGYPRAYALSAFAGVAFVLFGAHSALAAVAARFGRRPPLARARMARALATAVQAGLSLPRAVRLAADASANSRIRAFVERIPEHRLATASIGTSLIGCPHLTPDFLGVVATAEHTGDFTALTRLAELYEDGFV